MQRSKFLLLLGIVLLATDILCKWAVQAYIPLMSESIPFYPYGGIGVFKNFFGIQFSITHLTNTGVIWGALAGHQTPLLMLRFLLIVGLAAYLTLKRHPLNVALALLFIVVGAFGNVIDAFFYGHVIDMFYFVFWGWSYPVFNVADCCIFLGVAWLLGRSFLPKPVKNDAKT